MSGFLSSLYIWKISALSDVGLLKIFSHSVGWHFVLLTVSFVLQKLFSFMRVYLLIIDLRVCVTSILFKKLSPVLIHLRLFPTFSPIRLSVTWFMLRSLIYLDLSFVQGDKYGSICVLLNAEIQWYQHHLLKMLSLFHCIFLASLSKIWCL